MTYRTTSRGEWVEKDRRLSHEELMVLARLKREQDTEQQNQKNNGPAGRTAQAL